MLLVIVVVGCGTWLATWILWLVHKAEPIEIDAENGD